MPAGLRPLQADTTAFGRFPAPAPALTLLPAVISGSELRVASVQASVSRRAAAPTLLSHTRGRSTRRYCFSTRDAISPHVLLQRNSQGHASPRLCAALGSGGAWLLGCSPGFPSWVETSGQQRGSGRQRQASSASSPEHSTQFPGGSASGGPQEGGEGHAAARLKGGQTGPAATCSR